MKSPASNLSSLLKELIARDVFGAGSPASEIAEKVIATGIDSLTRAERKLYDAVVLPALRDSKVPSQHAASIPIDKLNASNDE
jgi:hypothetical protein